MMTISCEGEPEINICISGTNSRSTKRPCITREKEGPLPKKPKVAFLSNNDTDLNDKKTAMETAVDQHSMSDVSFRHLFSFGNTSQADTRQQDDKKALDAPQAFSFLDESNEGERNIAVGVESRFPGPNLHFNHTGMRERTPKKDQDHGILLAKRSSQLSGRKELLGREKHSRVSGDITGEFLHETDNRKKDRQFESKSLPSSDSIMIPDDIESRPDQILQLATSFCRKKSIDQLEQEWCAPGGVRETMRRDFKQKRQNVTRGRKLGSTDKRW